MNKTNLGEEEKHHFDEFLIHFEETTKGKAIYFNCHSEPPQVAWLSKKEYPMTNRIRMLIALAAGLLVVLLQVFFPALPFTGDQFNAFFLLIGAYIVGEGLEGERIRDNFLAMLRSNKFQALLAGLIIWLAKGFWPQLDITEEQVFNLLAVLASLILGAGVQGAVTRSNWAG